MAGFANARRLADAQDAGKYLYASFRKQATQTTGAGVWFDLSMSPGNPAPNYYIGSPGVFVPLKQSTDGGLRHGGNVSPARKFLRKLMVTTNTAAASVTPMKLLDYIGFYGFIDESVLGEQFLDNTAPLPRHADGAGVQLMPVVVAGQTGGQPFTVSYTNQDGVAGRTTTSVLMSTQFVNGTILCSQNGGATYPHAGPFLPLQTGDTGVRSVQSVTIGGIGDVGLFALVLVKPLASISLYEITAASETDYLVEAATMPVIEDDAYLNFIAMPTGTLANAPIIGLLETTWN
ncbi:MAG TPA: hypothetical protein PLP66_05045 [Phycisphaerae bacterium]|nr:hypothetical protein [Phycisphaerae bacterium]